MRNRKLVTVIVCVVAVAVVVSCGSRALQVIGKAKAEEVVNIENGKLVLTYHFNHDVKPSSVNLNTTFYVSTNAVDSVTGAVTFPDSRTVKFTSLVPAKELFPPGGGKVKVRMVGTSRFKQWVADIYDDPIDGNRDGKPGGDFNAEYQVAI